MKVLVAPAHVFLKEGYGSEVACAYNIISALSTSFSVQMHVICGEGTLKGSNVDLFNVGFSEGDLHSRGLFVYRYYQMAKKFLEKVDLVHHMFPFDFRAGFNPLAVFGHLKNKPFIIGPIQYPQEFSDITDYIWASGKRGIWARLSYRIEGVIRNLALEPLEELHKLTLTEAEALVFDSNTTLELCRENYADLLNSKLLKVIPAGVETEFFIPTNFTDCTKKDRFEILTVGYLLRRKGVQYLIRAMLDIVEEVENVKLRVVGTGPYMKNLMRLTQELSLEKHVEFSDYVPRHELRRVYANCDVYVQPSLSEAFPATIRESMAAGRAVVATDVGVVREFVKDGTNGCLVPPKSSRKLAREISDLLINEERRAKIGREARRYAEENFNCDSLAEAWYTTYSRLVD